MQRSSVMFMRPTGVLMNTWREQGITYLQYLSVCTTALHSAVGDEKRLKYCKFSESHFVTNEPDPQGLFVKRDVIPATVLEIADSKYKPEEKKQ